MKVFKLRALVGACLLLGVLAVAAVPAGTAGADPTVSGQAICIGASTASPGTALSGTYHNLTIKGNNYVAAGATLTVYGNLRIAPRGCLDAFSQGTVNVWGNIHVGRDGILGLGCYPAVNGPPPGPPCDTTTTNDTVAGNIVALHPWSMYLSADKIYGNVISIGGGPGVTETPYVNFPIKANVIYGNLIVRGWHGAWAGALRNTVYGNMIYASNRGVDPDSNEVVSNTISGNLICHGNSPAPQIGDALTDPANGSGLNTVGGRAVGQCDTLSLTTSS
ncbi:MAG: hypothetical protein ACRD0B_04735 [Acidimicrobiales bacterium]